MRPFTFIFMCLWLSAALLGADAPTKVGTFKPTTVTDHKVSIAFTGTVKAIEQLGERELSVIPVDVDPRFAVTVHIESATPDEKPFKKGEEVVFAIHSPAILFLGKGEDAVGKKYRFKLVREKTSKSLRYSQLTAGPIEDVEARRKQSSDGAP